MFRGLKGSYMFLIRHNTGPNVGAQCDLAVSNSNPGCTSGVSKASRSLSWSLQRFDEPQVQNAVPETTTYDFEVRPETVDAMLFQMEYQGWFNLGMAGDAWSS